MSLSTSAAVTAGVVAAELRRRAWPRSGAFVLARTVARCLRTVTKAPPRAMYHGGHSPCAPKRPLAQEAEPIPVPSLSPSLSRGGPAAEGVLDLLRRDERHMIVPGASDHL